MTIVTDGDKFVIQRNAKNANGRFYQFFSFYIDHDCSSWSRRRMEARRYENIEKAQEGIVEIKRREKMRRKP